jgi:DNA-binding transcriptional LysR family regulator
MEWDDLAARRLSTRDLRIFLATTHSGSMAKAAKMVGTSQPAVSKAIADMEHTLGVALLDRSSQGVTPTQCGRALVKCGIAIFNELKQGLNEIGFLADPTAGELRIGCPDNVAAGLVRAAVDSMLQKHPRMASFIETDTLDRQLREHNVELVIKRILGPLAEEDIETEILYHDTMVVVAGANSPWTRRRKVQLADLVDEPWVLPKSEGPLRALLIKAFQAGGLKPPRVAVTTSSYHIRSSFLATGRFLSVLPSVALKLQQQPLIKALPIELQASLQPIAIVTVSNRTLSPLARLFIEHAREIAKLLTKKKS